MMIWIVTLFEYIVCVFEKYKNLFTGRVRWVTHLMVAVVCFSILLFLFLPINYVFAYLVADFFLAGWHEHKYQQTQRILFLKTLQKTVTHHTLRLYLPFSGPAGEEPSWTEQWSPATWSLNTLLRDTGLKRAEVLRWIKAEFQVSLKIRDLHDRVRTIGDLARLVHGKSVLAQSPVFSPRKPRPRSWTSYTFLNLLDHVPSDKSRFSPENLCYIYANTD